MLWNVIRALTEIQYGLVTREQVLGAGGTDEWLRWAVRTGRLKRVRQGVYAIAGVAPEHQPLMAACLAAGPSAAASHLAAAALWGAEQALSGRVEITTFDNRDHRLPGVMTHRSRLDEANAITTFHDIPIVVPALTVVQVAATCHPVLVKSIANDLVKRHWTNFPAILGWLDIVGDRRRPALRELCLEAIDVGGHDDSPPARRLARSLRRAGVAPFELDYQVATPDGILRIDIAWPRVRVGLEYNGARDHDGPPAQHDDARRRCRLAAMGWTMLDANRGMTDDEIVGWVQRALARAQIDREQRSRSRPDGR
jgi:hypothetical protein